MEYRVLGPVEVLADGRPVAIGGPRPRSLLVLLLLNAGRVVPTSQVIEALWAPATLGSTATAPLQDAYNGCWWGQVIWGWGDDVPVSALS